MVVEVPVYALSADWRSAAAAAGGGGGGGGDEEGLGSQPHLFAMAYPLHLAGFGLLVAAFSLYVTQASKVAYLGARMWGLR